MKRAILFDFWQTLFHDIKERETFLTRKQLVRKYIVDNGHPENTDIDAAFEASRPWFMNAYTVEQRTPIAAERIEWVLRHCGLSLPDDQMRKLTGEFEELGLMLDPRLSENLVPVLDELRKDFALGIVSDTGYTPGRVLRKHMQNHGILEYFSAFSFSDETGRAKPHEWQFRNVLNQLGIEPRHAIHCGDTPTHDVRGAKNLGITAVLYTGCHSQEINGFEPDYAIDDWKKLPGLARSIFA